MSSPKNAPSGARLALLALLACAAFPAQAGDRTVLKPMLDVEQSWDSNIFNESEDDRGSLVTRVSPSLWVENRGELGYARLGLTGIGRTVWRESELSGIDGLARADFDRRITPRLNLFGNGLFEQYSGYEEIVEGGSTSVPGGLPGEVILGEQPSWKQSEIAGGFRYLLTERLSTRLSGSAGRVNFERVDAAATDEGNYRDRTLFGVRSALLYQLTSLDQLSLGVDLDDTSYQDLGFGTNDTEIWSSYIGWTRTWTPVWSSSATLGIRSLDTVQNDIPQSGTSIFGPVALDSKSFSNSGTGVIGSLSIQRAFARGALQLSYDRDTRSTGGASRTNFDIDSFTLSWTQRLAERVKLTLSGNYSLYHSVTDEIPNYAATLNSAGFGCPLGGAATVVAFVDFFGPRPVYQCVGGSSEEKRTYTTLVSRLEWQLRRTLSAYAVARYYTSVTDQTLGGRGEIRTEDLDKFTIGVGFRYYHDLGL